MHTDPYMPARQDVPDPQAWDERAIMQAAQHDPAAFAPLYERYFGRIYAYCLRRVSTPQEAEDLTSAVFIRVLKGLPDYRGGHVAAWLFRIARNAINNHYRSDRPLVSLEDAETILPDDAPSPIEQVLRAEERQAIRALVADLPGDQQDLLALKLVGELNSDEIGAVVGKRAGAVRVELHRIIKRLRLRYRQIIEEA
ncbi:MAG: sigma-70 family RNA polymerase sigma factor [Anaerolineae bacterium]|nr:sigma-70 family RNA polymerase sigma factor [Anaerolineae bacterium]